MAVSLVAQSVSLEAAHATSSLSAASTTSSGVWSVNVTKSPHVTNAALDKRWLHSNQPLDYKRQLRFYQVDSA